MEIEREECHGDEADKRRIDFMEAYGNECICMLGGQFYYRSGYNQPHRKAKTLRDAIDGAIKLRNRKDGI